METRRRLVVWWGAYTDEGIEFEKAICDAVRDIVMSKLRDGADYVDIEHIAHDAVSDIGLEMMCELCEKMEED